MFRFGLRSAYFAHAGQANFSTTSRANELRKMARVNIVDNSTQAAQVAATGRPARIIHIYNKCGVAHIGTRVLLAVCGEKRHAYIVGVRKKQQDMVPRYDSNNAVLVDDSGSPLGTRITAPLPAILRRKGGNHTKLMALATKFI